MRQFPPLATRHSAYQSMPFWIGVTVALFPGFLLIGVLMAKLSDVQASLDTLTASVTALAARIPPPAAATEADLDVVKAQIDAASEVVNAMAPSA